MDRRDTVFAHLDAKGHGLEIGPSHNPLAPKRDGYRVHIIDHLDRAGLVAKYQGHGVDTDRIEDVDFVWSGQGFADLTRRPKFYDWVIASHVIEHAPDLVSFLLDCDAVLANTGRLSLVVPDKRYCFDHCRPVSGLSRVIDQHLRHDTIHTPGTVAEYFLNVVSLSGQIAWGDGFAGSLGFVHSLDEARQAMHTVRTDRAYLDVHAWCFTPSSFRLLMRDLFDLGLIPLREVAFHPTVGCEFYVTLARDGQGLQEDRLTMLRRIQQEERQAQLDPP